MSEADQIVDDIEVIEMNLDKLQTNLDSISNGNDVDNAKKQIDKFYKKIKKSQAQIEGVLQNLHDQDPRKQTFTNQFQKISKRIQKMEQNKDAVMRGSKSME